MDHHTLLSLFDQLVAEGIINYSPPMTTKIIDSGFTFDFVISGSLIPKPQAERDLRLLDETHPAKVSERPTCFGPGSDIAFSDDRILLRTIRSTHLLVFNKFPVFRPQLLLLTVDSFRRQQEPLESNDLRAAFEVLQDLQGIEFRYYAFFNCGRASGASRDHKHIQIIPKLSDFFPDRSEYHSETIPYRHFIQYLNADDIASARLGAVYSCLLEKAKSCLGLPREAQTCPHNVIMTLEWMVVVPRRQAPHINVSTPNSAGMMGSVWLPVKEKIEAWKQIGPRNVLADCGVPADMA